MIPRFVCFTDNQNMKHFLSLFIREDYTTFLSLSKSSTLDSQKSLPNPNPLSLILVPDRLEFFPSFVCWVTKMKSRINISSSFFRILNFFFHSCPWSAGKSDSFSLIGWVRVEWSSLTCVSILNVKTEYLFPLSGNYSGSRLKDYLATITRRRRSTCFWTVHSSISFRSNLFKCSLFLRVSLSLPLIFN